MNCYVYEITCKETGKCEMISSASGIKSHQKATKHVDRINMKKTRNS